MAGPPRTVALSGKSLDNPQVERILVSLSRTPLSVQADAVRLNRPPIL